MQEEDWRSWRLIHTKEETLGWHGTMALWIGIIKKLDRASTCCGESAGIRSARKNLPQDIVEVKMKDLKIYYETGEGKDSIDSVFDAFVEALAKHLGLKFMGSGVETGKGIRDIHYRKEK